MRADIAQEAREPGGAFFTPSNTARQNYLYLQFAGEQTLEPGESIEGRPIDSYLLLYTREGEGELLYMDRRAVAAPGEGFVISCLKPFSYRAAQAGPWRFSLFNMNGLSFSAYYQQLVSAHRAAFRAGDGTRVADLIGDLSQSAYMKSGPQSELVTSTTIVCILTELIVSGGECRAEESAMPGYVGGIMEHLDANYRGQISLDSLADRFNVSKYHLSREFKRYTGYSPNEYLISVRISHAKELLKHTAATVGEIALMTGCGDANHFIQLFKSREGMTPAAFRKRWMGESAQKLMRK
jgi:AraC-like DNA-binding protein